MGFRRFKREINFWVAELGLFDWEIKVEQVKFAKKDRGLARVSMNPQQRSALVQWNSRGKQDWNTPEELALHEVLHILLNAMVFSAVQTGGNSSAWEDAEEHAVLKRLMRVLLKTRKGKHG